MTDDETNVKIADATIATILRVLKEKQQEQRNEH